MLQIAGQFKFRVTMRCCSVLLSITTMQMQAQSAEFAVENRVMVDNKLVNHSVTIFTADAIYDVLLDEGEQRISVYSPSKQRFRILDLNQKKQVVLPKKDLDDMSLELTARAKQDKSPFVKFAATPVFRESLRDQKLTLDSKHWKYVVRFEKGKSKSAATHYRQFADAFVRLNVIWSAMPPNARLHLNQRLSELDRLPTEVRVDLAGRTAQTSSHQYSWQLSNNHQRHIDQAQEGQMRFPVVGLDSFRSQKVAQKQRVKASR